MNLLYRLNHVSSAIKSSLNHKPSFKPTINLSILETRLQQCENLRNYNQILAQMILTGFIKDTHATSKVIKFSTESPFIRINHSFKILTIIEHSNEFMWNTLMRSYVHRKSPQHAIYTYKLMLVKDVGPDNYTFPILIQASAIQLSEFEGKQIHDHILKMGFDSNIIVKNTLINLYAVCSNMSDARRLFDESPVLDSVSWNTLLAGYVQTGEVKEAREIYFHMSNKSIIASNSMIVLFGESGRVSEARDLFSEMSEKDMVTWSALISCYEHNEIYEEAILTFSKMHGLGVIVDEIVMVSVLSACARISLSEMGKSIHGLAWKIGIDSYINLQNALILMYSNCGDIMSAQRLFDAASCLDLISWNSMISAYLKCGLIKKAETLFNSMPRKDIVSWSAMITGYAQHNCFSETLALFQEMQIDGVKPDETTLVSVISACTHLAALEQGRWIHAYVRKKGMIINAILGTTLIDMYMKCGCVECGFEVFHGMEEKKWVSTWNALILGLAMNGFVGKSLDKFSEMKLCDVAPNEITFIGVLGACRHMGLVDEGRAHFNSMINDYKIEPNVKHYGCMVDLLGRAGLLKEAEDLVQTMPMEPNIATWGALLGACRKHGDTEMGQRIGRKLIELQPDHDGFHVLLSNIYASKGNWENVLEIRGLMMKQKVVKMPGCSMIESNGVVHEFLAGDKTHPRMKQIEEMLDEMGRRLKREGYVPDINEVFLDVDEEEKETSLFRHSEKLAIAFGLIDTSPPNPIRIMKNLRICNDCHTAAKFISKAFNRKIIVRDRHRFHHFEQGSCSCMDYW